MNDKFEFWSTPQCTRCPNLEAWLVEKGIPFEKKNAASDPIGFDLAMLKTGQKVLSVPVLIFPDGRRRLTDVEIFDKFGNVILHREDLR